MFRFSMMSLIAVFAFSGLVLSDDKDDLKAMNGTWKIEKAVFMGTDSSEFFKAATLVVEGGKYSVTFGDMTDKGTLTVDSSKKPKRLTVKSTEGTNKDKTFECIYELKDDTMTVCYALEGKEPPKEFESKEGTMTLLATYKREKK